MIPDFNWCMAIAVTREHARLRGKYLRYRAGVNANPERKAAARERHRKASIEWYYRQPKKERSEEKKKLDSARATAWRKSNRARYNAHRLSRYHNDPQFKVAARFRGRLWQVLKGRGRYGVSRVKSMGLKFDKKALVEHLERLFLPGMTWANHGPVWHIDHVVPCSKFDLTKPEEVRKCFALSNLQPLWGEDNIRKSNKILKQIELPLAT